MKILTQKKRLKYILKTKKFYKTQAASVVIDRSLGPLNPAATYTLYGTLEISGNNDRLTVKISAQKIAFPESAGFKSLSWAVAAYLIKNGQVVAQKGVYRTYDSYFVRPGTDVIGEVEFNLPEFTDENIVSLKIEGSYIADFGPHGSMIQPRLMPFGVGHAQLNISIPILVEYDE